MCVIAAVSVVLPWSTWPIVPTFTCGLVRSNLPFAISFSWMLARGLRVPAAGTDNRWCPWRGSNARPLPYQGSALPLSHMGIATGLRGWSGAHNTSDVRKLERETGIEPASLAWKARVLPLNYSRPGSCRDHGGAVFLKDLWTPEK